MTTMPLPDHVHRTHAPWSASASHRNMRCPGAITLSANAPPETESLYAARGTACHEMAEQCLRTGQAPAELIGMEIATRGHEIMIDEYMAQVTAIYVDYVRKRAALPGAALHVEQTFTLDTLELPIKAGGTADAIVFLPEEQEIEIIDFKHGVRYVDAVQNQQLRLYAVGVLLAFPHYYATRVTVTIVQPRADPDDAIRSETFHVADLFDWLADVRDAMERSAQAKREYAQITGAVSEDVWAGKWLRTGECKWCPAEGFCPAVAKEAKAVVERWFVNLDGDASEVRNDPKAGSPEDVARDLADFAVVEQWIKMRRAYAISLAEAGRTPPGYMLVEKHGHRKWTVPDNQVAEALRGYGLTDARMFKLLSPAQIDKFLSAEQQTVMATLWKRPAIGTTLVKEGSSRTPVKSLVDRFFEGES